MFISTVMTTMSILKQYSCTVSNYSDTLARQLNNITWLVKPCEFSNICTYRVLGLNFVNNSNYGMFTNCALSDVLGSLT